MATISQAAGIAALNAIVDLVDAGSPPGLFVLQDGGDAGDDLVSISLNNTAFGAAGNNGGSTGAVASLDVDPVPSDTASASGTADTWKITNAAGTTILNGTIGTGSEDLDIDNTSVASGQTVNITSLSVTLPYSPT
jgi:hypothetical protein